MKRLVPVLLASGALVTMVYAGGRACEEHAKTEKASLARSKSVAKATLVKAAAGETGQCPFAAKASLAKSEGSGLIRHAVGTTGCSGAAKASLAAAGQCPFAAKAAAGSGSQVKLLKASADGSGSCCAGGAQKSLSVAQKAKAKPATKVLTKANTKAAAKDAKTS